MKKVFLFGIFFAIAIVLIKPVWDEQSAKTYNELEQKYGTKNTVEENKTEEKQKEHVVHKYTPIELELMALDHYERHNNYRPQYAHSEESEDGKTVRIQLYGVFGEGEDKHMSTSDWYTVDMDTAKGTDLLDKAIDLLN